MEKDSINSEVYKIKPWSELLRLSVFGNSYSERSR